jgi:signal transduction histidine kinase/CheY-like chemotaxis protein
MVQPGKNSHDEYPANKSREQDISGIGHWLATVKVLASCPDLDFEEARKRKLFAILTIPGICILFTFSWYHLSHANLMEGLLDLAAGIWLIVTLAAFRLMKTAWLVYRANAALIGCLFIYLAIQGGVDGNKLMWSFSFPLLAFYTLGRIEGLLATAILYGIIIGILYLPLDFLEVHVYAKEFKIRFCGAFFLVAAWTYIYESVREAFQANLENKRINLKEEKSKLAELSVALTEANQALSRSEARLTRAQAIARVGNLEYHISSQMIWGSEEALRILGIEISESEFPLDIMRKIVPAFDDFRHELTDCMNNNREYDRELTIHRMNDGQPVVLHAKAEVVRNSAGTAERVIGVIQDISDRKKAERDNRQLEEKLARSRKMEALGLLAGGVAHDLNNVLSGIVGYPDMLLRDLPADNPLTLPLQRIRSSGQKAAAIVQDLLTLARRGVTNQRVVNLNDLIGEYISSPEHGDIAARHAGVSFELQLDPDLLNIIGSAMHLKKTLANLVANSAEALPAGGYIRIGTENRYIDDVAEGYSDVPEGDYVMLQVEDNGIGIAPEDLERIFEPFYTKKKMGRSGTGLGMAVVWGTVTDHRGYIHIDTREGFGTRIDIYFPATRDAVADERSFVPLEEYVGSGETILVVDDVPEQRELAGQMLAKLGYRVHTATGGEAALQFLSEQPVDLVILDMIMDPGIDGLETYIRILKNHPEQRTIIVSGFSETDRVREAQRLGARCYVKKPYTLEKLGVAVRQALTG